MTRKLLLAFSFAALTVCVGCEGFKDPTPTDIFFEVRGEVGTEVDIIYSTQFIAGVDENGTTTVQVFSSDTVHHTLPVDTVFNIVIDRQWFVMILPPDEGVLALDVIVDVDDRGLLTESGGVFAGKPWSFVYMFNRQLTRVLEVEF
jgi:hypothetical protein